MAYMDQKRQENLKNGLLQLQRMFRGRLGACVLQQGKLRLQDGGKSCSTKTKVVFSTTTWEQEKLGGKPQELLELDPHANMR